MLSSAYNGNSAVHMDSWDERKRLQTHRMCALGQKFLYSHTHTYIYTIRLSVSVWDETFFLSRAHWIHLHFNLLNVNFFSIMVHNLFAKEYFSHSKCHFTRCSSSVCFKSHIFVVNCATKAPKKTFLLNFMQNINVQMRFVAENWIRCVKLTKTYHECLLLFFHLKCLYLHLSYFWWIQNCCVK